MNDLADAGFAAWNEAVGEHVPGNGRQGRGPSSPAGLVRAKS